MSQELRFGGYHAKTLPPTREGSLWAHIAVVDFPGFPVRFDRDCPTNKLYFLSREGLRWFDGLRVGL